MKWIKTSVWMAALSCCGLEALAQDMIGVRWWEGKVYLIDSGTGMGSELSNLAPTGFDSMARDDSGTLWMMAASDLWQLDPVTGAGTNVATMTNLVHVTALAYDKATNSLLAVEDGGTFTTNDKLYSISLTTLTDTLVANMSVPGLHGMTFHPNGTLYGWETGAISSGVGFGLVTINPTTGAVTDVNPAVDGKWIDIQTLTFGNNKLYGVNNQVHTLDLMTGVMTVVGGGGYGNIRGIEFINGNVVFQPYCMAKVNSLGCVPSIAGTGAPSATLGSGFPITCTQARNNKPGLLFYTVNKPQNAILFQCGTLCVGPGGIRRTPASSSGGTPPPANDCSGVYTLDMNAFAVGAAGGIPAPELGVSGTVVDCQWWGRDQGFAAPCNTMLSDAGEYTVGP